MSQLLSSLRRQALCCVLTVLSACAVGPNFERPAAPADGRYTREPQVMATVAADGQAQHFSAGAGPQSDWWELFKSPLLDAQVRQALANNQTLKASEASLRQSQEELRAGSGVFFPRVDAGLAATRQRSAPSQQGLGNAGTIYNLVTLSGSIGYALDIFGGKRRAVEGLGAQVDAQSFARQAAYLTLSANVVNTCIAIAAYHAQILATEQLLDLEQLQLHATETQVDTGTAPYSSLLSVRSLMASNRAQLAPLRQRASQAEHLLASLASTTPADMVTPDIELRSLVLPGELPVSLPSDLVRQRPDILIAEAQLHVASANIGVATAAMFPSISLSGGYGAAGSSFDKLGDAGNRFWSAGTAVAIPVFQGGSLWHSRKAAIAAFEQSQASYRQVVLNAFEQVADALTALDQDAQALQAQVEAQRTAGEALELVQANYEAGVVAYLDVLAADVQFHEASLGYLQSVAQRHQDTVALFVALGGGWWNR